METLNVKTGIAETKEQVQHYISDGEQYVRQHPTKSVLVGMGTGFLLAQLPLRFMLLAILKIALIALKPAVVIYAVSKIVEDVRES